jgi:hypothetical protein
MASILEAIVPVGKDGEVAVKLPPGVNLTEVKVTLERPEANSASAQTMAVPTLDEILTWPVRHEHPTVFLGRGDIPAEATEPMGEEELGDWENNAL